MRLRIMTAETSESACASRTFQQDSTRQNVSTFSLTYARRTIYTLIAAVAVLLFTATPAHADILAKNRSESCFNATRCQLNGAAGLCNTTDVPMIGHRATIVLTGNLAPSSTVV